MNSRHLRVGLAAATAIIATAGVIVVANASSPGADQGQPVGAGIGGPHLAPLGDDSVKEIPAPDVVVTGTTPSEVRYEVAVAPDGDGQICYEIRHGAAAAMGCGVELSDSSAVTIPAAFGDDIVVVTFTGPGVERVKAARGDGVAGPERSAPVTGHGFVRFAHVALRVPQETWPMSKMAPDSDAPAAPPVPPELEITTYDASDRVLERKTHPQGPVG